MLGVVAGDELWIVDAANARLSVFDSTLSLVHDRPLPGRVRAITRAHDLDAPVLATGFLAAGDATRPVARLARDGAGDVFGGELESGNARVSLKVAARDSDGRVWTFANSGGAVNVLDGDDLTIVERWWLPDARFRAEAPRRPERGKPPVPQAVGAVAADDVVWLLMAVADEDWSPDVNPARDGASAYWDTAVLAIDAGRREIVARGRLDTLCQPAAPGLVSCVDELGEAVRILRLGIGER